MVNVQSDRIWHEAHTNVDIDNWIEHIDRHDVSDHFAFLAERHATTMNGKLLDLHEWLNALDALTTSESHMMINDSERPSSERLAIATFLRWRDRIRSILEAYEKLPSEGVLIYFSEKLAVSILVAFRRIGSAIDLNNILAAPDPNSVFDPVLALRLARSDSDLDLIRRSLLSRHKLVIHRNVLTHVDRELEAGVFGPSIDTLFLNEWLFENRYESQRTLANVRYFEELIAKDLAEETAITGTTFLEIGSGNGLLTGSFAKNEAKVRRICAIDISMDAIIASHRNSASQRRLPQKGLIGDRSRYIVGKYHLDSVPTNNDLVVSNPPYVPFPEDKSILEDLHPLARATLGTSLLSALVSDSESLISEDGQLVVVVSEMAEPNLQCAVPKGIEVRLVVKREVPFSIGPLNRAPKVLDWLRNEQGLKHENGVDFHNIAIFLLNRKGG